MSAENLGGAEGGGTIAPVPVRAHDQHSAMDDQRRNPGKVFVGGLGQGTTDYSLKAYFSQFGTVEDAAVVADKMTNRSRGFGFSTFATQEAAERCLAARHKIDGVSCEVRRAVPRDEARGTAPYDTVDQPGKLFVGGLPEDVTEERLREYFDHYGKVRQATLMYDKNNHRPRGFGFIVYQDMSSVDKAIGLHTVLGRSCEAKKAEPRPDARRGRPQVERFERYEGHRWMGGERMPPGRYGDRYVPGDRYGGERYADHHDDRYDSRRRYAAMPYGGPPTAAPGASPGGAARYPPPGDQYAAAYYDPYSSYYDPYAYNQPQYNYGSPPVHHSTVGGMPPPASSPHPAPHPQTAPPTGGPPVAGQPAQQMHGPSGHPAGHVYGPPPDAQPPQHQMPPSAGSGVGYYGAPPTANGQMYGVESSGHGGSYSVGGMGYQPQQGPGAPGGSPVAGRGYPPHRSAPRYSMVRAAPY